jgi:hypothetical protein
MIMLLKHAGSDARVECFKSLEHVSSKHDCPASSALDIANKN